MSRYERNTGIRGTLGSIFGPPTASYQDEVMRPSVLEKEEIKVESALELEQSYKGRHVIVTGASGAIGSEVAKILLNAGAKVVLFGRDMARGGLRRFE